MARKSAGGHRRVSTWILIAAKDMWASPCEKSKKKVNRQKMKFQSINMKENKSTGQKSPFLAYFFWFFDLFGRIVSGLKMPIFLNYM